MSQIVPGQLDGSLRRRRSRLKRSAMLMALLIGAVSCSPHADSRSMRVDAVNLLDPTQRSIEQGPPGSSAGWATQGNASIARSTAAATDGKASLRVVGSSHDPISVDGTRTIRVATSPATDGVRVKPGHTYAGRVDVMSPKESSPVRCELRWYDESGAIMDTQKGAEVTEVPAKWTETDCAARAPGNAAFAALRVHIANADFGDVYYVDNAWLIDSTDPTAPASGTTTASAPAPTTSASTTSAPTTAVPAPAPAPTTAVPAPATPPRPPAAPNPGGRRTESNTGPRVANPDRIRSVEVFAGENVTISDVITDGIIVHGGGSVTATNVRVNGSVVVIPELGKPVSRLHLTNAAVTNGITINAIDSGGTLYWGGEIPVDVAVSDSWIRHPQGGGSDHTEALAGFGFPRGATFTNTSFIQSGPFNGTATATINWHGADTTFDGNYFGWSDGTAAYYTVYVEGRNNVVRNSRLEAGLASFVYPDSSPPARYVGNTDAGTGAPIAR